MNEQTLQLISSDLTVIKWLLVGVIVLLSSFVVGIGVVAYIASKEFSQASSTKFNFHAKGRDLLNKGEIEELLELALGKLEKYPDHDYANYFIAICYYRKENIHKAFRAFKRLEKLRPGWSEEFIAPYLKELEVKIKNSKPEILK